jgi:chromosome segregation ATPase
MAETKLTGIRADAETTAKFKEISEQFPNAGECLKALINTHEMAQAKQALTGQETSIQDFQTHVDSLVSLFISTLELSANAENRIRQEFRQLLDSKDETIISLQDKVKQAETIAQQADERAVNAETDAQSQIEEFETALQEMKEKLETATNENQSQAETLTVCKSTIADKERIIISLQTELETAKAKSDSIPELENSLTTVEKSLADAQKEIDSLKQQLADEKQKAEIQSERAEIALQKAVLVEQSKATEKAQATTDEIKSLYAEISRLKDIISELKQKPDKPESD